MRNYTPSQYIDKITNDLKHRNRFFVDDSFNAYLDTICKQYEKTIKKEKTLLYRARIYSKEDRVKKYHNPEIYKNKQYFGYDEKESFVNMQSSEASDGRANPSGIPYLYATFDMETAIKEIKPYANTSISVAEIKLFDDLHIIDLCTKAGDVGDDWETDLLMLLCQRFSQPTYEKGDYLLSQYISEYVKNKDYDGIAFLSAYTNFEEYAKTQIGKNITIFNFMKCKAINSTLYTVNSVSINYSPYLK